LLLTPDEGAATTYDHDQALASQLLQCAADREPAELVFLDQTQFCRDSLARGKLAGADGLSQPVRQLFPGGDIGIEVALTAHDRTLGDFILLHCCNHVNTTPRVMAVL
jgi:hypothetical protein